jgi:capsular polysaccharide biosynthesis protein
LAGKVKAVAAPSEYRIAIEVDDADPVRAQAIANAAADAFVQQIRAENEGKEKRDISIAVLERADLPGAPFAPRPKRDAAGAAVAGALIGLALAFLLEFWDDSVKTAAEAATLLDLPVLGTIPRSGRTARDQRRKGPTTFVLRPSSLPRDR